MEDRSSSICNRKRFVRYNDLDSLLAMTSVALGSFDGIGDIVRFFFLVRCLSVTRKMIKLLYNKPVRDGNFACPNQYFLNMNHRHIYSTRLVTSDPGNHQAPVSSKYLQDDIFLDQLRSSDEGLLNQVS